MLKAASSDDLRKQAKDFMVDNFLFEALQNPRDRLARYSPLQPPIASPPSPHRPSPACRTHPGLQHSLPSKDAWTLVMRR